ncbi:unnamed protein product [Lathyrus oleraceus]
MNFVKKCKRVLGSSKRLCDPQDSYGKISKKQHKQKEISNHKKPPHGCLFIYVGPERQRFVIKIKIFNHPLFRMLLEGVENEYGYRNDGPLWIPCHVELFCEVLVEIESGVDDRGFVGCSFPRSHKHKSVSHYSSLSCDSNLILFDANDGVLV